MLRRCAANVRWQWMLTQVRCPASSDAEVEGALAGGIDGALHVRFVGAINESCVDPSGTGGVLIASVFFEFAWLFR